MNYYPIFNNKRMLIKQKNNNYVLSLRDLNRKEVTINLTAYEILNLCDGLNSIDNIFSKINDKYNNILELENIYNDIFETLKSFNKYGIVTWKKENPFEKQFNVGKYQLIALDLNNLNLYMRTFDNILIDFYRKDQSVLDKKLMYNGLFYKLIHGYVIKNNSEILGAIFFKLTDYEYVINIDCIQFNEDDFFNEFKEIINVIKKDISETLLINNDDICFNFNVPENKTINKLNKIFDKKFYLENESSDIVNSFWII